MTLTPQQRALLDAKLATDFVPKLPALLKPEGSAKDAAKNLSRAFAAFAIASLCDVGATEAAAAVVDDYGDHGLDAIYYEASSETLFLIQAKLKEGVQFSQKEANDFVQGVRKIINQDFSGFNAHILARQPEIDQAREHCSRIELVIAQVGSGLTGAASAALDQMIQEEKDDEERLAGAVTHFDAALVVKRLSEGQAYARVDGPIILKPCICRDDGRKTYIGFIAVEQLIALHRKHGRGLYDKNIRQNLGSTDVRTAIRNTLATAPSEFEYLNNGVTILADKVEPKDGSKKAGKRLRLTGMSVINGAQTIASCAAFADDNQETTISSAFVPITVIQADHDGSFSKRVTRARNHQNPVLARNFAALDDTQERLRRDLSLLGVHYAYKDEGLEGAADPKRIDIAEAAQALAIAGTDPRFPVYLRKEPGQFLNVDSAAYQAVFTSGVTAQRLLNSVLLLRYVQGRMVTEAAATHAGYERLTYRHGAPALAFVLAKRLETLLAGAEIIDESKLGPVLSTPFDDARQKLCDAVQTRTAFKGPLAILRNVNDALPVLQRAMTTHYGLEADPVLPHKARYVANQPYPIDLFNYLASKAPQIGGLT